MPNSSKLKGDRAELEVQGLLRDLLGVEAGARVNLFTILLWGLLFWIVIVLGIVAIVVWA